MKRLSLCGAATAALLLLGACGGGGGGGSTVFPPIALPAPPEEPGAGDGPRVSVDELGSGSYVVSTGDADAPTVGKYYAAANGARLLVLGGHDDVASQAYRRNDAPAARWTAVPAPDRDVNVALLQHQALKTAELAATALAGRYVSQVAGGEATAFRITADGQLSAEAGFDCRLSGALAVGVLPGTLMLELHTQGCATLPASAKGVLVADADYAPARFRLLADDGERLVDLWAYTE